METVTFALTPHTSAIIVQRRRYVDAILRSMETKKQLRSRVLARRDALPEEVRARKSAAICARLEQVLAEALAGAEGAGTAQVSSEGTSRADATAGARFPLWPCSRRCAARWTRGRSSRRRTRTVGTCASPAWCARSLQRAVAGGGRAGADEAGGSPVPSEPRAGDVPRMPSGSRAAGEASERRAAGRNGDTSGRL